MDEIRAHLAAGAPPVIESLGHLLGEL
jgi:hypothetical protein